MTDPLRVAADLVDMAARREPGVEARARVSVGESGLTRFANSFIHQNVAERSVSVSLEVAVDGRFASAHGNRTDDTALGSLVDSALAAARVRPPDPRWAGMAPPAPAPDVEHFDPSTSETAPDRRAEVVERFVTAGARAGAGDGGHMSAAGFCETSGSAVAFANTAGQSLSGRASRALFDGVQRAGGADGVAAQASVTVADLDGGAAGAVAAAKARAGGDPVELAPGRYEVVLEPRCVADLLDLLSMYGFNARSVEEGQSFARLGEDQMDRGISLCDDATDPRALGLLFDYEGTPKRRVPLVDAGRVVGLAHDRRTAARAGVDSTGHAVAGGESWGAAATNLFLSSGSSSPDELVAGVDRGLLVSDFWYTRVLDPKTLVVTGLTRNGVFLIENGEVTRPVTNLRFTQSYPGSLAPSKVLAVGSDARLVSGYLGVHHVPSLRLASWNFTGNARG